MRLKLDPRLMTNGILLESLGCSAIWGDFQPHAGVEQCLTYTSPPSLRCCRILDDVGGAFGMGAVGGGLWHLFKGMKNSPSGSRFRGGIEV